VATPVIAPVTVANGVVFVSTSSGLVALDANTGDPLWDDGSAGLIYSQPVVVNGTVYVAYFSGRLVAYRLTSDQGAGHHVPTNPHR
jgi:outer membrane protein assembly factor BamB